jgi:hypothetical protein
VPAQIATKDFRQTVAERAGRDPEFREALVVERAEAKVREIAAPKERTMQGLVMKYFVLKPAGKDVYAAASRRAMNAYAKHIKDENPQLSEQLHNWAAIEGSEAYFGDKEPS